MATSAGHLALSALIPSDTTAFGLSRPRTSDGLSRQLPDQAAFPLNITSLLLVRTSSLLILFPLPASLHSSHTSQLPLCSPLPTAPNHFPHQSAPFPLHFPPPPDHPSLFLSILGSSPSALLPMASSALVFRAAASSAMPRAEKLRCGSARGSAPPDLGKRHDYITPGTPSPSLSKGAGGSQEVVRGQ